MALSRFNQNIADYTYGNYYVTGGYAYTEDHIMVTKLFVNGIQRDATVDDVRKYFSRYGNVKELYLEFNRYFPKTFLYPSVGFVQFENPTAAARALNDHHQRIPDRTEELYFIKVCNSWNQPNFQSTKKLLQNWSIRRKKIGEEKQFVPPNRNSILRLNDDCLDIIMRLLPISSQLHFARTCSRICQVFKIRSKSIHRTLSLERLDNLTQWEIREFFDFAGDNIIRIEGQLSFENQRIVKFFSIFCNNLEELDIDLKFCKTEIFIYLIHQMRKLKTLKLTK